MKVYGNPVTGETDPRGSGFRPEPASDFQTVCSSAADACLGRLETPLSRFDDLRPEAKKNILAPRFRDENSRKPGDPRKRPAGFPFPRGTDVRRRSTPILAAPKLPAGVRAVCFGESSDDPPLKLVPVRRETRAPAFAGGNPRNRTGSLARASRVARRQRKRSRDPAFRVRRRLTDRNRPRPKGLLPIPPLAFSKPGLISARRKRSKL
jgi:hypothetical protein